MSGPVGHLRTKSGDHEIDIIVERDDMKCVALEVKLSDTVSDDVKHLQWLKGELGDRLVDRVILNTGPHAYRRRDGVALFRLLCSGLNDEPRRLDKLRSFSNCFAGSGAEGGYPTRSRQGLRGHLNFRQARVSIERGFS